MLQNLSFAISRLIYKARNKWVDFWSTKDIAKKIFYTLFLLIFYIIGTTITAPYIKLNTGESLESNSFLNTLNLVGGGGLSQFSIFALGISPFINASLIMMVLQSRICPPIYKLSQSGPQGRRKINIITRFITVLIAYPQAIFLTKSLSAGKNPFITFYANSNFSEGVLVYFLVPMILVSASLFALFISEQITNKGIGNGTSLIIFTGIVMRLPNQFKSAFNIFIGDLSKGGDVIGIVYFIFYLFVYFATIMIIAIVYSSERHIPIQQIGAGRSKSIKEMGKMPIKLNPAGIMPVIFAMMVLSFPTMIANILPDDNASKQWINLNLQFTQPIGFSLLLIITFVFSLIMGIQQSRVDKVAEDFAKNSTFIPGVRPGEETQDYLIAIVFRLSIFSGIYLVILASMQFAQIMTGALQPSIAFGGTGLMILVSVALETISQLQARKKTTKLAKAKRNTISSIYSKSKKYKKNEGLLW